MVQAIPMTILLGIVGTWVLWNNYSYLKRREYDNGVNIKKIDAESGQSRAIYHVQKANVTEFNGIRAIIQMDKEVYLPNDKMHIRVVFVYAENGTLAPIYLRRAVSVKIVYPDKHENQLYMSSWHVGVLFAQYHLCTVHIAF